MKRKGTFNGFANYETWAVSLWMANDRDSYLHYRQLARDVLSDRSQANLSYFTRHEATANQLARILQDKFSDASPIRSQSTVYSDLMNAALSEVDWYELAEELLNDIKEE